MINWILGRHFLAALYYTRAHKCCVQCVITVYLSTQIEDFIFLFPGVIFLKAVSANTTFDVADGKCLQRDNWENKNILLLFII